MGVPFSCLLRGNMICWCRGEIIMRRKDREISGRENIEPILQACKTCRLAMVADGAPYVIPLNYGYTWYEDGLTIYFHSGIKGKKIDALRADPRVCFEMDTEMGEIGRASCRERV